MVVEDRAGGLGCGPCCIVAVARVVAAAVSGADLFDVGAVARVAAADAGWHGNGPRGRGGGLGRRPRGRPRVVAVVDLVATEDRVIVLDRGSRGRGGCGSWSRIS